jgi:hypothetical protein
VCGIFGEVNGDNFLFSFIRLNPPFLTMVTGLMMIGIALNFFVTGKDPYVNQMLKFSELKKQDNINLKVVN